MTCGRTRYGDPTMGGNMRRLLMMALILGCAVSTMIGGMADAHHSTAEFDYTKGYVLHGVVKEYQWTNPHSWVQVLVPNAAGGQDEWGFELGAPVINIRTGWTNKSVAPGDDVTVVFCPSYARARGTLLEIILPGGATLFGVAKLFYKGPDYSDPSKLPPPPPLTPASP
jgi:hypothetical protein